MSGTSKGRQGPSRYTRAKAPPDRREEGKTGRLIRFEIAEESMAPALLPGDYVLAVRFAPVRPGDVVAFPHPDRPDFTLVKRVVEVDGGEVVVLGDNASRSAGDSRELGPIPLPAIEARIVFRYWPLTRIGRSGLTG